MSRPLVRTSCAAVVIVAALLISACGRDTARSNTLRFWAMGREGEVVTEIVRDFERTHPDIRVEVQTLPWSAAHEKLLTAFAGDTTPDLCQLGNTWIPEFVALGALRPLDDDVARSSVVEAGDYFPGIWATNQVDGKLYGVPWYVDTRLLFYRRDLLAQAGYASPPRSWADWTDMLEAIRQRGVPQQNGIVLPAAEVEPLVALALQQPDELLRDGGRFGNFQSKGLRRALEFYVSMFRRGYAPPPGAADASNIWNEFGRGHFVFYISGPWNIGEFRRRLPASLQGSWMTAPLPGADGPGSSIAGGASLVIFRKSRNAAAAWQLIEYLSQPEVQRRFHAMTGDLPPRRTAWGEGALADDVYARAFRDQLERVRPTPAVPEWERIANEIRIVAERVVHGDLTVDQGAAELDARTDRILEKRRWLLDRARTTP